MADVGLETAPGRALPAAGHAEGGRKVYRPARSPRTKFADLKGVEVFAVNAHRGRSYTVQDLDDIVRNFYLVEQRPELKFRPPVVLNSLALGHEDEQPGLLSPEACAKLGIPLNSGVPKIGRVSRLWRRGNKLLADFTDVPEAVARLIDARAYDGVSAEIYPRPPKGLPGSGRMLRRVALMGGEIPELKNLAELPYAQYYDAHAERRGDLNFVRAFVHRRGGEEYYELYSEYAPAPPPGRAELVRLLGGRGYPAALLERTPDASLRRLYLTHEPYSEVTMSAETGYADHANDPKATQTGDDPIQRRDAAGPGHNQNYAEDDEKKLDEMDDSAGMAYLSEKIAKYRDLGVKRFGDAFKTKWGELDISHQGPTKVTATSDGADGNAEGDDKKDEEKAEMNSELQKFREEIRREKEALRQDRLEYQKLLNEERSRQRRDVIDSFCEEMYKLGKITRPDCDAANPYGVKRRLLRADARVVVEKYSENGKAVEATELDLQMAEIRCRPAVIKFGEIASGDNTAGGDATEAEHFYEAHRRDFEAVSTSKEEFLDTYRKSSAEERRALLTA